MRSHTNRLGDHWAGSDHEELVLGEGTPQLGNGRPQVRATGLGLLTFLGNMKDSFWSIDVFRCESATFRTHSTFRGSRHRHRINSSETP
jgi:hypothetical protein